MGIDQEAHLVFFVAGKTARLLYSFIIDFRRDGSYRLFVAPDTAETCVKLTLDLLRVNTSRRIKDKTI